MIQQLMEILIQPLSSRLSVRPGANLLEALRENQIPISYSCMAGRCGTCRCKVIEGNVLESGAEIEHVSTTVGGYVLACQTFLTQPCTIELAEVDEAVVHAAKILKATVESVVSLNHDVKRVRLTLGKAFDFSPGQYAQLQFAPNYVRPYSMAGSPSDPYLEFHVRVIPGGRVTGYIATELKVGDAVRVSGPMGSAYLRRKHAGPMLCVAGGTGLAPVLSIVRGAIEAGMKNPIHLYFGIRTSQDIYGLEQLSSLRALHPELRVHVIVAAGAVEKDQRSGLVTEAIAQDWNDLVGWRAYLCGSPPMVEATTRLVHSKGVHAEHIYADAFYASSP